mgnify:CR=1 FL=1
MHPLLIVLAVALLGVALVFGVYMVGQAIESMYLTPRLLGERFVRGVEWDLSVPTVETGLDGRHGEDSLCWR